MAISRKDPKGRKLREGENWRNDGRYSYRYTDVRTGKRLTVYAQDLPELREKEKQIAKDMEDNILTDGAIKKMTLNTLFERYMATRELADTTRVSYVRAWENRVKDEIGNIKVVQLLPSHIKAYYAKLSKAGYAYSTIKYIHNLLYPALEMAVDDDIIRKNPAKSSISDYGKPAEEKEALTVSQQEKFMEFVKQSNVYNTYYPMFTIMIGTGLRCGEICGLQWNDVHFDENMVEVNHTLVYYNHRNEKGCYFNVHTPKTAAGNRQIPMTDDVREAFLREKAYQDFNDLRCKSVMDGYTNFIFINRFGHVQHQGTLNKALRRIIRDCNDRELSKGRKNPVLLPNFSCHSLRHTFTTRLVEAGINIKVIQELCGHTRSDTTLDVYTTVTKELKQREFGNFEQKLKQQKEEWKQISENQGRLKRISRIV